MTVIQGILLGLIQGLTEFLPVSSTGHLAIAQQIMGFEEMLPFDVTLHLATLLAVVVYFHREILALVRGFWYACLSVFPSRRPLPGSAAWGDRRLFLYILLASIPTGIIGLLIKKYIESALDDIVAVGVFLMITGIVLFLTRRFSAEGRAFDRMKVRDGLVVGVVQGIAALPGISRSGSTISAGIFLGLDRALAARFSFLLSVPAVLGAVVLKMKDIRHAAAVAPAPLSAAFVVAFLSGLLAIWLVFRVVQRRRFEWFAPYCWVVGAAAVAWGLWKALA